MAELSKEERIAELWRRGRLRWKLYPDQREVYDAIKAFIADPATRYEQFYLDICRQYGKTFIGVLVSTEFAIEHPGARILYTCATRSGLWQFVHPNMETLLADCPDEYRPRWNLLDSSYHFPNGSQVHLAGVNNDRENDARGPKADLVVNEEAAFVDRLDYLVSSIELPMLTTTGGRILFVSTPPESPAHEAAAYKAKCEAASNYCKRTIDDNRHLSEEAKEKLIEEMGGRDATKARRELWCEWIIEEERAIIPEFSAREKSIVTEWKRPPHFEPYETMDPGFSPSQTAVLFGYYDFLAAKLVIEDELILSRMRTDQLADGIKAKELALWEAKAKPAPTDKDPDAKAVEVPHRWSDIEPILLNDLGAMHRLNFAATSKDTLDAMVNKSRMWVKGDRVRIHPRCKSLIAQLKSAVWNKSHSEFDFSAAFGHFDAIAAFVYMIRNVPEFRNCYPAIPDGATSPTHWIPQSLHKPQGNAGVIQDVFGGPKRRM